MAAEANGTAAITEALQATSLEDQGHKVFVGNLAFSTKESELKEIFGAHGTVKDAQIILRGTRSLGYGFVTFASQEDAQKAVGALDKKDIGGRTVNVEIAKPPPGAPGGSVPKAAARAAKKVEGGDGAVGEVETSGAGGKRPRKPRKKRSPGEPDTDLPVAPAVLAADDSSAPAIPLGDKKPAGGARRGTKGAGAGAAGRAKKGPPTGEPSKTLLFVANLPFSLTDDGLKTAFGDFKVVSSHVVKRRFGPAEGRSKGFGFVDFESESEQQKALSAMDGKEVEGRALQVKVAVSEQKIKAEEEEAGAGGPTGTAGDAVVGGGP